MGTLVQVKEISKVYDDGKMDIKTEGVMVFKILEVVNELPEKQRLIMQLRDIEGESYKKIATLLNLTEEQVKVNLFRARQKVKQRYLEIDEYGL